MLEAVGRLGGEVEINPTPQEVPWEVPLDEDYEHATYDTEPVATYFEAATQAALVLAEFRAPFRGRSTPVNAWWGTFDLAVNLFSGHPPIRPPTTSSCETARTPSRSRSAGGRATRTHGRAAFFAFAYPPTDDFPGADLSPAAARWDADLGEYVLDWEDIREDPDPHALALEFARSAFRHACAACDWDPVLAATAEGVPPPIR